MYYTTPDVLVNNDYYLFGLKHKGYNNTITGRKHKYGFGGKEYNDELGLDWYDVSARNYDPALGRWMNIDPLAEQMRRHSPYNFGFDNPIYFQDYDGMMPSGTNPIKKYLKKLGSAVKSTLKSEYKSIKNAISNMSLEGSDNTAVGTGTQFTNKNAGGDVAKTNSEHKADIEITKSDGILAVADAMKSSPMDAVATPKTVGQSYAKGKALAEKSGEGVALNTANNAITIDEASGFTPTMNTEATAGDNNITASTYEYDVTPNMGPKQPATINVTTKDTTFNFQDANKVKANDIKKFKNATRKKERLNSSN